MNAKGWIAVKYLGMAVSAAGLIVLVRHAKDLEAQRDQLLRENTELNEQIANNDPEFIKVPGQNAVFMCSSKADADKRNYVVEGVTDYRMVDDMWEFHGGGMLYRLYQQGDEVCSVEVE